MYSGIAELFILVSTGTKATFINTELHYPYYFIPQKSTPVVITTHRRSLPRPSVIATLTKPRIHLRRGYLSHSIPSKVCCFPWNLCATNGHWRGHKLAGIAVITPQLIWLFLVALLWLTNSVMQSTKAASQLGGHVMVVAEVPASAEWLLENCFIYLYFFLSRHPSVVVGSS